MPSPSEPHPIPFLDVPVLLERSTPRARGGWFMYGMGGFLLLVLVMSYLGGQSAQMQGLVRLLSAVSMMGIMGAMAILFTLTVRKHRDEQRQLEAAEELVQLRRWQQAAVILQALLSRPTRSPQSRVQALIYLTSVLGRYHRFNDAILVQTYLLENIPMDPGTTRAIKLGRAIAMLREDHLVDADRAISELRRGGGEGDSAGLALVEIYRDVKTGHAAEGIGIFHDKLPVLRDQLGHRVGDAYALAAKSYDLLGQHADAQAAWDKATTLEPVAELQRRYPEVAPLAEKYAPAPVPQEVA